MEQISFFRELYTVLHICWIFFYETINYGIFRDWPSYIERTTTNLARVNILYVKVFQAFASNNNLIDEETNNKLLKFTDKAPWTSKDIDIGELIEIGEECDLYFKDGYKTPINSGMISIVFKAQRRKDGVPVIVKMKRKNIDERLNESIENLKTFLYLVSFLPFIKSYQISDIVNKNISIIRQQTDFNREVENILKVKENCKNLKYVKIPDVDTEVTKKYPNCIIMEYIDGLKINEVDECDRIGFAKSVLKFGFVSTIIHSVAHGDLHCGNILFIKDDDDKKYPHKIGVIDFGIIFELDNHFRDALFELFTQMFKRPPRETMVHCIESVIIENAEVVRRIDKKDYDAIIDIGTSLFKETILNTEKMNQSQLYKFLNMLKDYLSKPELTSLGIRPSDKFVQIQLVLAMAHGATLTLCKENIFKLMDEVLNELFHTELLRD